MSEQITKANAGDQPELHRLWETVFGDPPEIVQAFFECFPPEVCGWVLRKDGRICSAAYLIPGNWYMNQADLRPAAYVYAVATEPSERGKGYAGRLMKTLSRIAEERNLLLYTRPAEESLFPWYASSLGARNIGCTALKHQASAETFNPLSCRLISAVEYGIMRERILANVPHIVLSENFLRLQEAYSQGYFAIGDGCCNVVSESSRLYIPELLISDAQAEEAVNTLMQKFEASNAVVLTSGSDAECPVVSYTGEPLPADINWGFFLE